MGQGRGGKEKERKKRKMGCWGLWVKFGVRIEVGRFDAQIDGVVWELT